MLASSKRRLSLVIPDSGSKLSAEAVCGVTSDRLLPGLTAVQCNRPLRFNAPLTPASDGPRAGAGLSATGMLI